MMKSVACKLEVREKLLHKLEKIVGNFLLKKEKFFRHCNRMIGEFERLKLNLYKRLSSLFRCRNVINLLSDKCLLDGCESIAIC